MHEKDNYLKTAELSTEQNERDHKARVALENQQTADPKVII